MGQIDNKFLSAISASFKAYNKKGGARSTKKLKPIHKFLSEAILRKLGKGFSIKSLGIGDGKEATLNGKYYLKDLDIAVFKKEKIVATISFKFVTSNYKQNANNYFENLMGETANIRRQGVGFAHFLVLRGHTPYYSKNKGNLRGKEQKTEIDQNEKEKIKQLFPGYVFVEMMVTDESWYVVRNTPRVTGFLGSSGGGTKPVPLAPDEINQILLKVGIISKPTWAHLLGKEVEVTGGTWSGMKGKVTHVDDDQEKLTVDLDLFGRGTPTEIDSHDVKEI